MKAMTAWTDFNDAAVAPATKPAQHVQSVALELLGDPTESTKTELRYGSRGSLSIDLEKGTFFDHEQGHGGGVLDLIVRERGGTRQEAAKWLEGRESIPIPSRPATRAKASLGRVVATYAYHDEAGGHLFDVVRFDPKDFRQRGANGSWKIKGVRKVLYRLPRIAAAPDGATVYIVEGEKDVHRLEDEGLLATTNPGGAGKWHDDYTASLKGKQAVIVPDNDQAGRDHAKTVRASLARHGITCAVLNLSGLAEKGDVADWLDNGNTVAELERLGREAMEIADKPEAESYSPAKNMVRDLRLVTDKTGRPYWNTANAVEILTSHEAWRGVLAFNEFTRRRVLLKPIPGTKGKGGRNLEDDDATAVLSWFNRNGFPKATANVVLAAMHAVARLNTFDPLKDYLDGLQWDGKPRVEDWLTTYCGAEASDYTRETGKRWMISAVARAMKPGCKADHMIVLEGEQGARKSSALSALAGEEWFTDALPPMNTKDASDFLRGRWIVEVAELEAMRREMDAVKAFISRQIESFRPAYGRETVDEPRRCIFAGTTNKDAWLRDETGGRRFWPVRVGAIDLDAIKRDRAQLWAEAVALFKKGEKWWLEGDVEDVARNEQASRMADDPWLDLIGEAIAKRHEVTIREILASTIGLLPGEMRRADSDRAGALLKRLGWKRAGRVTSGALKGQARFVPPD